MNTDVALQLVYGLHKRELELFYKKGAEYRLSDDQLDNFHRCARELGVSPLQAAGLFLEKHMSSIKNYIKNPKPDSELSEPIFERIVDARNYLFFIHALIEEATEKRLNEVILMQMDDDDNCPSDCPGDECHMTPPCDTTVTVNYEQDACPPVMVNNLNEILSQAPTSENSTDVVGDVSIMHHIPNGEFPTFDNVTCGGPSADEGFGCTSNWLLVTCPECMEHNT